MENLLNPRIKFVEENPEVKSFIYQQLSELEPFLTETTQISVVSRDPRQLALQLEAEGRPIETKDLKKMYRIEISLTEEGAEIKEEALEKDIFEAVKKAKEKLLLKLTEIQDEVMSNSDRQEQINMALSNTQLH